MDVVQDVVDEVQVQEDIVQDVAAFDQEILDFILQHVGEFEDAGADDSGDGVFSEGIYDDVFSDGIDASDFEDFSSGKSGYVSDYVSDGWM